MLEIQVTMSVLSKKMIWQKCLYLIMYHQIIHRLLNIFLKKKMLIKWDFLCAMCPRIYKMKRLWQIFRALHSNDVKTLILVMYFSLKHDWVNFFSDFHDWMFHVLKTSHLTLLYRYKNFCSLDKNFDGEN